MKYLSTRNKVIVGELVRTDFKVRYQGSVLGYAWSLLRPLLLFTVIYIIFARIIPLGEDIENYPIYLLTGIIFWNFFSEATSQGLTSIVARGDLIRKINLPKYLLVFSTTLSSLINLCFGLIVLFLFAIFNGIFPTIGWLMIIPLTLEMIILVVGISFLLSSLYVKFRDISYIWEVVLQIGFYASAIIFPISLAPAGLRKWFFLNPVAQIVQDLRSVISTPDSITIWSTIGSFVGRIMPFLVILVILLLGSAVFRKRAKTFAEDI